MPTRIEWALVADGRHARILEHRMPSGTWSEHTGEAVHIANPPAHEQGSERPGHVHESLGSTRHAIKPRLDPHRAAKKSLSLQMADRLEALAGRYAPLLLVAQPTFLGDLREALGQAARERLSGTLDKDLVKLPLAALAPHLDAVARG